MYGCNKLYCEQLGTYYARHYKQLAAERASGQVDFRCVRFPGLISALTDAVGRDVGLRAGDDPRGGERGALQRVSSGPTRGSRSWRCPTASTPCCAGRGAAGAADADRVQRRGIQPVGRGDPRRRRASVPEAPHRLVRRHQAARHRGFVARRRRRQRRAPRLGLHPQLDFDSRLLRLPRFPGSASGIGASRREGKRGGWGGRDGSVRV